MSDLDDLLRLVMGAGHDAAIDARRAGETGAEVARVTVREALRCGLINGLISMKPRDTWPEWVVTTPPYTLPPRTQDATNP